MAKSNKPFVSINSLGPQEKEKLKNAVVAINDSMTRSLSERLFVRDAVAKLTDEIGLDPKMTKKLSKTYFNANFNEEIDNNHSFEELYTHIFLPTTP